jgi:DMSO/TMAO reductase YedYZ molybdopterin-dependent catalytic subunit
MNGATLPMANGFPLRLIAPGWYGIANVKWLKRIEVRDTRFMGRFMARDYVTVREELHDGETFWSETSVGRWRLASAPSRVTRRNNQYRVLGMAWGGSIGSVEVQIDGGAWRPAAIDPKQNAEFAWKFWSVDWPHPASGDHIIASRAFDTDGNVQPPSNDPSIAGKHTYWESNGQAARHIRIV